MDNDRKRKGGGDSSCGSSIADDQVKIFKIRPFKKNINVTLI